MVDKEFLDALVTTICPYVQTEQLANVKMQLDILLHDYDVKKMTTELTVYQGDVNHEMLVRFLRAKVVKGCTKRTVGFYQTECSKALAKMGKPYNEVTPDDIRYLFALRMRRDGVTRTTAGNEYRALSAFYSWLQTEEILIKNPMNKVDPIRPLKQKKKAFTQMEIEKIRAGCRTKREQVIIEMMLSTWCRITELVNIKIADISDGKCIVLGKGNKEREVYINARAQIAIDMYLKERKDTNPYLLPRSVSVCGSIKLKRMFQCDWYKYSEYVDPDRPMDKSSVEGLVRGIGRRVGVEKVHPHRFRRTGATMALRAGMPLIQVSKLMGHENIATTQIYLDISDEELEAAHVKYVI